MLDKKGDGAKTLNTDRCRDPQNLVGKRSAKFVIRGDTVAVRAAMLKSARTTSCGCAKREIDEQRDFKNIPAYVDDACIEFAKDISKPRSDTSSYKGVRHIFSGKSSRKTAKRLDSSLEVRFIVVSSISKRMFS